ncbi:MAG: hypothetical protein PHN75_19920 [Syntrophales bacterium]|nr:hypothetical protein [Syntrophales bacterium]
MEDDKTLLKDVAAGSYNAADMPFDFVAEGAETALVCEPDPNLREKTVTAMKALGYRTTAAEGVRDALKKTRIHIYDMVILNEHFDTANPDANDLLTYFSALPMSTRRQTFLVLTSNRFRTMDNMTAFNKSVNMIVNLTNIDDLVTILKKGLADHAAFYQIFRETLKKMGKL